MVYGHSVCVCGLCVCVCARAHAVSACDIAYFVQLANSSNKEVYIKVGFRKILYLQTNFIDLTKKKIICDRLRENWAQCESGTTQCT